MADGSEEPPAKPRRRTTTRGPRKQTPAEPAPEAAAATPAAAGPDTRSLNQWVADISTAPHRIEVFDRWWEFKQPTGGRAAIWDTLCGPDIQAALAFMLIDPAKADEFLTAATEWVPPADAEEFWARFGKALFGLGEA